MKMAIWIFVILLLVTTGSIIILRIKTNKSPVNEIKLAREMLSEAELEKSPCFAPQYYQQASMYFDSAMIEWKNQNKRLILFRNYGKVAELAKKSAGNSQYAINRAKKNISDTEVILEIRIQKLGKKIENFEEFFNNFPISKKHRIEMVKCKLLYLEGKHAYENKNYSICKPKLDWVEVTINDVFYHYREKLITYFKESTKWDREVKQTISHSKKDKSYAIIVDKLAREILIYQNGELYKRFTVELGDNWVGDKQWQGDKTTPEGLYKVIDKKQNRQTMYYKVLLLNYPNEEDKKRFILNKKNGIIKQEAKIGNLIEIHGNGGKGIDWTDGCIALQDTDMDVIFTLCPVGTKVTIVGSTKSFDELSVVLK